MLTKTVHTTSSDETIEFGERFGSSLVGGEVIRLISDVGGGKTTLVKGLAVGLGCDETVQSPTFIISATYECTNGRRLYHYDFYRLNDAGLMKEQLAESQMDPDSVTVIEWGDIVEDVIADGVITVRIQAVSESERRLTFIYNEKYSYISSLFKESE